MAALRNEISCFGERQGRQADTRRFCNHFQVRGFVLPSEIIWIPVQAYVRLVRGLIDLICQLWMNLS